MSRQPSPIYLHQTLVEMDRPTANAAGQANSHPYSTPIKTPNTRSPGMLQQRGDSG